jgi:epoxyqueuosine reductase
MNTNKLSEAIYLALEKQGYRGKLVSIKHSEELEQSILDKYHKGLIDETLYQEYRLDFDFDNPFLRSETGSLIIVAAPQPHTRVTFDLNGKTFPCIVPPTYCHVTDESVEKILAAQLKKTGHSVQRVIIPYKVLAVRSGLVRFGRNNITYAEGMGSYFRLSAFFSDLSCPPGTNWTEPKIHDQCQRCSACLKACPAEAIPQDRFLLRAERCLTFHNERQDHFPQWIDPSWHNCLIGCLHCQRVCPIDKNSLIRVQNGPSFAHHETKALLDELPIEQIPPETKTKFDKMDLTEYTAILGRNLRALMRRR